MFEQVEVYYKGFVTDVTIIARRLKRVAIHLYSLWHEYAQMIFKKTSQIKIQSSV